MNTRPTLADVTRSFLVMARDKYGLGRFMPDELPLLNEMARLSMSESGPSEVRPPEPLAGSQAGSNGPSGSPTPDSDRVTHEGRIRMVLGGPHKGDWIGFCTKCDWRVAPRPIDHTLGEQVREHARVENLKGIDLMNRPRPEGAA